MERRSASGGGQRLRDEWRELGDGHTITFEEPLWPGTPMRSLLLARPPEPIIPDLTVDDRVHVEFLQAIPLFDSELALTVSVEPTPLSTLRGSETILVVEDEEQVRNIVKSILRRNGSIRWG